jgi:hypothetical protein
MNIRMWTVGFATIVSMVGVATDKLCNAGRPHRGGSGDVANAGRRFQWTGQPAEIRGMNAPSKPVRCRRLNGAGLIAPDRCRNPQHLGFTGGRTRSSGTGAPPQTVE